MAIRATEASIRAVMGDVDESITDFSPFINAANALVDELLAGDFSEGRLTIIETWLAAHFVAIRDPQRDMEKAGTVQERYQYKVSLGLAQTRFGQMAKFLDTTGKLANQDKKTVEGKKAVTMSSLWAGSCEDWDPTCQDS